MLVYFDPLYVTDAPAAYAVQLANAGRPEQLTCAEAVLARAPPIAIQSPVTIKSPRLITPPLAFELDPPQHARDSGRAKPKRLNWQICVALNLATGGRKSRGN